MVDIEGDKQRYGQVAPRLQKLVEDHHPDGQNELNWEVEGVSGKRYFLRRVKVGIVDSLDISSGDPTVSKSVFFAELGLEKLVFSRFKYTGNLIIFENGSYNTDGLEIDRKLQVPTAEVDVFDKFSNVLDDLEI